MIVVAPRDRIAAAPGPARGRRLARRPSRAAASPRLRRLGLDRARGEVVAFTEDSCRLARRLGRRLAQRVRRPPRRGRDRARSSRRWATGRSTGPSSSASTPRSSPAARLPARLAGNNFAVRRDLAATGSTRAAVHESEVRRRPPPFVAARGRAGHVRRYAAAEAIRDRLRFGLEYGRRRGSALGAAGAGWRALLVGPADPARPGRRG